MNNLSQILSEQGLQPNAPQLGLIRLCYPCSPRGVATDQDAKWIATHKSPKRWAYIRMECGEFERNLDRKKLLVSPPLWILVIFIDADHIIQIPIWRGMCPYKTEPKTDSAVISIAAKCIEQGGLDIDAIQAWLNGQRIIWL